MARYQAHGFTVLTPGYPGIEPGTAGVAALREDPSGLAHIGVREVMDHLTEIIEGLESPPIIMGHSFGGTFAQLLVGNGLGVAGVSLDGAGVKGIKAMPFSEIRSTFPILKNPANRHKGVALTPKEFHYTFTNTLNEDESQVAYDRLCGTDSGSDPVPGRIRQLRHHMLRPLTTSPTMTGHRSCSSRVEATTSCRRRSRRRTTGGTPSTRRRSPPTRCSPAGTTTPVARKDGKLSPTSHWTGR